MQRNKDLTSSRKVKKNPGGAPISIVNQQIDIRPFGRREQDVPSWRNAHKSAESIIPRRILLYDLYADVDLDPHVEAVTGKRRDAVTTANWQFVGKDGKPVDAINEVVDSVGFEEMLQEIINSKFWGYSILEPTFFKDFNGRWEMAANLINRLNYRPEIGVVAKDYSTDEGINIREGIYAKTVMEVGKPNDLGLYLKVAPFQILKRGSVGDWAQFVQNFGDPLVDAVWDGFDESQRVKLLNAIAALGSGGAIVRPAGTEINLIANPSSANGDLQKNFKSEMNKEISKGLIGSTETTEASSASGYAQSKTHEGQDERKNESDINFTRRILNSRFIKILGAHGFDVHGGHFIVQGEDNELTMKESFEIHKGLHEMGLPMNYDFFYDTYGIPKPDNKSDILRPKTQETEDTEQKPDKKPKAKQEPEEGPKKEELKSMSRFLKLVSGFFPKAPGVMTTGAMTDCCGNHHTIKLALSAEPDYSKLFQKVKKAEGKAWLYPELVWHNIQVLLDGFERGWKNKELVKLMDLGIAYGTTDPKMHTAWEMNLFKFSTVKGAYQSAEVNKLFRQAKNFREFERMVKKTFGVTNRQWLITEYNTAYQTAEAASTYYRLLEQQNTFPYWQYKTIGDDRVRDSHRSLHDIILPANHPLWKKIFPPNGWGCRCYVVPRLAGEVDPAEVEANIKFVEDYLATDEEWKKAAKQGFGSNAADTMEVFDNSQSYSNKPKAVEKRAGDLTAENWGMKPAKDLQAKAEKEAEKAERAIMDELWGKFKIEGGQLRINDYRNRELSMPKQAFDKLADTDAYLYAGQLDSILNNPDEVWINNQQGDAFDSFVYLKYFKNEIIRVNTRLDESGNLRLVDFGTADEKTRRGLVVKK
ncbi:phage portal protein family protein [Litoribacter populi]|uniref:phage portal protein family protein n=1 Tax=Litoribacter populi TaxID=2598460 RepID=UPI00117FAB97|nr:DUF935 family protein [Litoribacter populi]